MQTTTRLSAKFASFAAVFALALPIAAEARNGNGNGNGQNDRNENSSRNERGQQASALRNLNAARANENALLNASPDSNVGQIAAYRDSVRESSNLIAAQNVAAQNLLYLQGLSEVEIAALYPSGEYEGLLADATAEYLATTEAAQASVDQQESLFNTLTGGRVLSESERAAFHEMLGL